MNKVYRHTILNIYKHTLTKLSRWMNLRIELKIKKIKIRFMKIIINKSQQSIYMYNFDVFINQFRLLGKI